jgi:DNA modification methylase
MKPKGPTRSRGGGVRDRIEALVRVRAGDLLPNPSNWRRHPDHQARALRSLLAEVGYADALLARREGERLVLIDGHLRSSLDPEQVVPVLVLDIDEREADLLLATLDPLAALATPEPEALSALLERVKVSEAEVRDLLSGLARSAGLPAIRPAIDPDEIPPKPKVPKARAGDLWVVGDQRILCGDATSAADLARLMGGDLADVLLTDPPYGVSYVGKTPEALRIQGDEAGGIAELLSRSFAAADPHLSPGARIYLFHPAGSLAPVFLAAFTCQGWRLHQILVWVKDRMVLSHADYHFRHEPIAYGYVPGPGRWGRGSKGWYGGDSQDSVIEIPRPGASRDHPTAKPIELISRLLTNSSRGNDAVLDPFLGSGTTLVCSAMLGRRGFGLEIDPAYCEVAVARLEQVTGERARLERA